VSSTVQPPISSLTTSGIVIANKVDLEERAVVKANEGLEFAKKHGLDFFQTSAVSARPDHPLTHTGSQFGRRYPLQFHR
jgi:hypothetical protein